MPVRCRIASAEIVPVGRAVNFEHPHILTESHRPPRQGKLAVVVANPSVVGDESRSQVAAILCRCYLVAKRLLRVAFPRTRRVLRWMSSLRIRGRAIAELVQSPVYGEPRLRVEIYIVEPPSGTGMLQDFSRKSFLLLCLRWQLRS